jgi:very-short-patch-repair endonuclease
MMKRHYKSDKESKRDKGIGVGSSDPTPTLPEREGVRFVTNGANSIPIEKGHCSANESLIAKETNSLPIEQYQDGAAETNSLPIEQDQDGAAETDTLPIGEGWGGVLAGVTKVTGGRKPGYITANPYTNPIIKDYRKDLKDHQTEAENVLWEYMRNKKTGHKIRRQHVIGDFIIDFACLSKKVIIEIDGKIHNFQKEQDELRTIRLNKLGCEVIRFTNTEVLNSPYQVA